MALAPRDRLLDLLASTTVNGIDYVEVREADPKRVFVHFLNGVDLSGATLSAEITGGDRIAEVAAGPIAPADWSVDFDGRPVLALRVAGRGDHSTYTLQLSGAAALDPHTAQAAFSFFAFCPSDVDCAPAPAVCPPDDTPMPAIDYLARDYDSFKQALSEFSAQRYPEWRERAEADLGMVLLEAMSAIGDELSYLQDRIHAERAIDTATERRSIVRLARLVDYEPRPLTSARALVQVTVAEGTMAALPSGIRLAALAADGSPIPFETGTGLRDLGPYRVNATWNAIAPYWWDDAQRCLAPGASELDVIGHGLGLAAGQSVLIDTTVPDSGEAPARSLVRLSADGEELTDPLYGQAITRLRWDADAAPKLHHDLRHTRLRANLVPVTQGVRRREAFAIATPPAADPGMPVAIARLAAGARPGAPVWQQMYPLRETPLAFLADAANGDVAPELILLQAGSPPREWGWVGRMLGAGPFEAKVTLEPMAWRPVARTPAGLAWEYDGADGATIRFGDGVFGELPNDGDVFQAAYRIGRGQLGNVPVDTITEVDPAWAHVIVAASNPFPAEGGADAESDEQVRRRAPYAFQNRSFRAVRTEDYNAAAARLPWVQRAGTVFRWTGSWPTVFTTADPRSAGAVAPGQMRELTALLNRYRLAGYEAYAPQPAYVSFDLRITLCARPDAFRGDVIAAVRRALDPVRSADAHVGFFHVDNFTLGTAFSRSRLEAAIQAAPGVAGVSAITYRRRGQTLDFVPLPGEVLFAPGEIFRLDNNASRPERGAYSLTVEGGK